MSIFRHFHLLRRNDASSAVYWPEVQVQQTRCNTSKTNRPTTCESTSNTSIHLKNVLVTSRIILPLLWFFEVCEKSLLRVALVQLAPIVFATLDTEQTMWAFTNKNNNTMHQILRKKLPRGARSTSGFLQNQSQKCCRRNLLKLSHFC